jgi:putative restriction endonuclease
MAKAVFTTKAGSGYDDDLDVQYHFPSGGRFAHYLLAAMAAEGDWILYQEPRRNGGRMAYVAVVRVEADPRNPGHHYAYVSDALPFDQPVPLEGPYGYYEQRLRAVNRGRVGTRLQGHSVRPLSGADFTAIVLAGLAETRDPGNAVRLQVDPGAVDLDPAEPPDVQERRIAELLSRRPIRDAAFRLGVLRAYEETCAFTRVRIVNGGGRAEVQAAHIRPVAEGGPDLVTNGIALSATVHWMFDRGLVSIDPAYRILVSHNKVPAAWRDMLSPDIGRMSLPADPAAWPHPKFLEWHRTNRFGA